MSKPVVYNPHMGLERLPQENPKSLGNNWRDLWFLWEESNASGYCEGLSIWGWPVDMGGEWIVNGVGSTIP